MASEQNTLTVRKDDGEHSTRRGALLDHSFTGRVSVLRCWEEYLEYIVDPESFSNRFNANRGSYKLTKIPTFEAPAKHLSIRASIAFF